MIILKKLTKLIGFSEDSTYEEEKSNQGFSKMKKCKASFNLKDLEKYNSSNLKSGFKKKSVSSSTRYAVLKNFGIKTMSSFC